MLQICCSARLTQALRHETQLHANSSLPLAQHRDGKCVLKINEIGSGVIGSKLLAN